MNPKNPVKVLRSMCFSNKEDIVNHSEKVWNRHIYHRNMQWNRDVSHSYNPFQCMVCTVSQPTYWWVYITTLDTLIRKHSHYLYRYSLGLNVCMMVNIQGRVCSVQHFLPHSTTPSTVPMGRKDLRPFTYRLTTHGHLFPMGYWSIFTQNINNVLGEVNITSTSKSRWKPLTVHIPTCTWSWPWNSPHCFAAVNNAMCFGAESILTLAPQPLKSRWYCTTWVNRKERQKSWEPGRLVEALKNEPQWCC